MIFHEIEMDNDLDKLSPPAQPAADVAGQQDTVPQDLQKLRDEFQSRLVVASLRTEAVRAGMIDLDGLKLIDLSAVRLGSDDRIISGRKLMDDLKRNKPWLFVVTSSSSATVAPASQPTRQKMAMEMTDDEYAAARTAITKYQF